MDKFTQNVLRRLNIGKMKKNIQILKYSQR